MTTPSSAVELLSAHPLHDVGRIKKGISTTRYAGDTETQRRGGQKTELNLRVFVPLMIPLSGRMGGKKPR